MKSHDEIRKMLAAMVGNDLPAAEQEIVRQHVAQCPECWSELARLQTVVKAVRETPEVDPPSWLTSRIMARVEEEAVPKPSWLKRLFLPLHIKLPIEGLALLMICVVAWYVMQEMGRSPQMPIVLPKVQAPVSAPVMEKITPPPARLQQAATPAPPPQDYASPPPGQAPSAAPSLAPPPAREQSDRMGRSKAATEVMPSAVREQATGGSPAMAERKMAATMRKADSSPSPAESAPLRLRLDVSEPDSVNEKLSSIALRLGGTVVDSRPGLFTVRIEADRLPELIEQISRLGRVVERPIGTVPSKGTTQLQVVW